MPVSRNIRIFWWKSLHDIYRLGRYWTNIPGYESRARCTYCGDIESMEHILLQCPIPSRTEVWQRAEMLLIKAGVKWKPLTLGTLWATPITDPSEPPAMERIRQIVITESAHLIWCSRCDRVITNAQYTPTMYNDHTITRWYNRLQRCLSMDIACLNVKSRSSKKPSREVVSGAWINLIMPDGSSPDDWTKSRGVLVGRLEMDAHGVG